MAANTLFFAFCRLPILWKLNSLYQEKSLTDRKITFYLFLTLFLISTFYITIFQVNFLFLYILIAFLLIFSTSNSTWTLMKQFRMLSFCNFWLMKQPSTLNLLELEQHCAHTLLVVAISYNFCDSLPIPGSQLTKRKYLEGTFLGKDLSVCGKVWVVAHVQAPVSFAQVWQDSKWKKKI